MPETEAMTITLTGHAEIDQQHELLESSVERLARFCTQEKLPRDAGCDSCTAVKQKHCRTTLTAIAGELAAFLTGHSAYEEKMMELLPPTPSCRAHVVAHKAAHDGIAKLLKKLTLQIADDDPRRVGSAIMQIVGDWLGDHSNLFDSRLVSLGGREVPVPDFDSELVAMLDRHVFPNRPKKTQQSAGAALDARSKKLEIRGRFESLSPAQRVLFWLAVAGNGNREIAETLGVSINTVKTHRATVFQKMDVASVLELVKKADLLR
jgi:DNA-binding CsgD family transcriptional regulator/hemerythrin